jgi:hypothetical protein
MTPGGNTVNKLCAAVALACVLAAPAAASAAPAASSAAGPSLQRAESAARQAVAPLVVERAVCIAQARRRVVCFLAHPDVGPRQCRSVVLLRARRVRVLQSNVCFEFRKVTP